jgi:hypothetical protein
VRQRHQPSAKRPYSTATAAGDCTLHTTPPIGSQYLYSTINAILANNIYVLRSADAGMIRVHQRLPFGATFVLEETGPLADADHGSNRIAAAISGVRDAFLLETIADRLNADDTVLVVFGGSHLMILRPALDAMLGQPCCVGSELSSTAGRC